MPGHRYFASLSCLLLLVAVLATCAFALSKDHASSQYRHSTITDELYASLDSDTAIMPNGAINESHVPKLNSSSVPAFLIIDVQNCFLPGGAISVAGSDKIIPTINKIRQEFFFRSIVRPLEAIRQLSFSQFF